MIAVVVVGCWLPEWKGFIEDHLRRPLNLFGRGIGLVSVSP